MTREQFPIVTQGAAFYPALARRIVELTMPNLALKPLLQDFFIKVGASATIMKQSGQRTLAVVGKAAEGQEILWDYTPYDTFSVIPYKTTFRLRFSRELLEDQINDMVEDQMKRAARRVIMTIDQDIEGALNATAANSFAASGSSIFLDGSQSSFAGTIGVKDITNAKQVLQNLALEPDTLAFNPAAVQDLYSLPQFAAQLLYGQGIYASGTGTVQTVPQLYGLKVISTPNIPLSGGRGYMLAAAGANYSAAYAPLGYFVTKRPLDTSVWPAPVFDSLDVVMTTRYAPVITYPEGIVKFTSLRTS
jgi:hypothetical protein